MSEAPPNSMPGLMVAGTASGVGKTTVALAIIACLRQRGYAVQPFKGGPDFLDTTHHTRIAGRQARNLDTWLLSESINRAVLQQAALGADALVVEGMMGLYDGKDGLQETGSSAEIAKLFNLPVLLVVDCAKSARSIAAVALGFETFDPDLPLAGILLNRVASPGHYRLLADAIHHRCKTPILGWLPREPRLTIPERHLGLYAAKQADRETAKDDLAQFAQLAEANFQVEQLLRLHCPVEPALTTPKPTTSIRIGVARDAAFSFYYQDNLDLLRSEGAEIVPFSPIAGHALPQDLDALYLGGGYPELHARALSENLQMLQQIRDFAHAGGPIYAECGGLLYLSQQLKTVEGTIYPLAGILPLSMEMTEKLVDFGYVTVTFAHDCLLGPKGTVIRGHSFHYSRIASSAGLATSYELEFSLSGKRQHEGFTIANVLASYVHLHFGAHPNVARTLVTRARSIQQSKAAMA